MSRKHAWIKVCQNGATTVSTTNTDFTANSVWLCLTICKYLNYIDYLCNIDMEVNQIDSNKLSNMIDRIT